MKRKLTNADKQLDLFFADFVDPNLRDERDMMEYPFFSLEKNKRIVPITYERHGVKVEVTGNAKTGIATIWDADFLIWVASQLNEAIENGETPTRRLWINPYQYLLQTRKDISGAAYKRFEDSLRRLQGTTIETNIHADGKRITNAWSWIDSWASHKDEKGRIKGVEVVISEWLFSRITRDRAVLSIDMDYFLLTGGVSRWLYRLARKHCGSNEKWTMPISLLYEKSGSTRDLKRFKYDLKQIIEEDCLPEYYTAWYNDGNEDRVEFKPREETLIRRRLPKTTKKKSFLRQQK